MSNIAIILSGGVGTRMGKDIPKQYLIVNGQPIINYCLKIFLENTLTDYIVIGVADEWKEFVSNNISKLNPQKPILYSQPGETRQLSIYNALKVLQDYHCSDTDVVLIHDAARPLIGHTLIDNCYNACKISDGVLPVIPVKDTLYYSTDGKHISSLLNRNQIWSGQSPEAFIFGKYLAAHSLISRDDLLNINGSTELAYKAGLNCQMIKGDPMNFKITTPEDLSNFESIIIKGK